MPAPEARPEPRRRIDLALASGLIRGASGQTLGAALLIQAMVLVSGVVAARALGAEDRGILALIWLIPTCLALIGGLGLPQATTFFVARRPEAPREVVRTALVLAAAQTVLLGWVYGAILILLLAPAHEGLGAAGPISLLAIPAVLFQSVGIGVLQGQQRFRAFNLTRAAPPALYALSAAALYLADGASLNSITASVVAAWAIGATVTWAVVAARLPRARGERAGPREMLRFGARGVIGSVSPVDDLRVDQLLVGIAVDARALGLYVAALAFANLPRFVGQSIGLVAFPRVAAARAENVWALVGRTMAIGTALILAAAGAIALLVPVALPFFLGEEFRDSVALAEILLFAAAFQSLRRLMTEICRGLDHPGYGSIGELANLVLMVPLVLLVAPEHAAEGIAVVVAFTSAVSAGVLGWLLLRLRPARAA